MAKLVTVRLAEFMGNRAALHEQDLAHPGGFAAIDTQGKLYTVAMTSGVALALSKGFIELVDEDKPAVSEPAPVEPERSTSTGRKRAR